METNQNFANCLCSPINHFRLTQASSDGSSFRDYFLDTNAEIHELNQLKLSPPDMKESKLWFGSKSYIGNKDDSFFA